MKIVVFCSSQRFKKELDDFMTRMLVIAKEKDTNLVILHPEFEEREESFYKMAEEERLRDGHYRKMVLTLVYDHLFRKIKVADVCYIFNKDGYLGPNVIGELFAAAALGKMIYALEDKCLTGTYPHNLHEEPCCRGLIHKVLSTPEELIKYLV